MTPDDGNMICRRPCDWPSGVRVMLTAFLALIGVGYLFSVANIYYQHEKADGRAGLSLDDIRAAYSGLTVAKSEDVVVPSRMLTMLRTSMREYVDDADDFAVLEDWLKQGGDEAGLTAGPPRKTPQRVMIRHCLRCHAQSTKTDISRESPFGPDEFTVDYAMIAPLAAGVTRTEENVVDVPPQLTRPRLVLVTHAHMLAIPVFTVIVGGLFAASRGPRRMRNALTPIPMVTLAIDFTGWWLARAWPPAVYMIFVAGAIFGVAFGLQLVWVVIALWRPAGRKL